VIRRDDLLENVRRQGDYLSRRLNERFGNHPFVGDLRGRGLFQGIEIVSDRGTKEPFDPSYRLHARIKHEAMARGLMIYPMGGTVDCVVGSAEHLRGGEIMAMAGAADWYRSSPRRRTRQRAVLAML
jgi:adenosylmethionine-8-amino-7-oxononanoate aminotransferase